jgi:benzylsuccinate CoA-transferase BbsF subunit
VITALSGVDAMTGYPGERPMGLNHGIADPNAALHTTVGVLAALFERHSSGFGQRVDASQLESMIALVGGHIVAAQVDSGVIAAQPLGNRDPLLAPCGVYPAAGDDKWVALACPEDSRWPALAHLIGRPEWAAEGHLATAEQRARSAGEIDDAIATWTSALDRWEAVGQAQAAGIAAGPLLDTADRFADEHLWAREDFAPVEHPVVGSEFVYGLPWKLSRTPGAVTRAAPLLGQDTREVLTGILGMEEAEVDRLTELGVLR